MTNETTSKPQAPPQPAATPKIEEPGDQFLNSARRDRTSLVFRLRNGRNISGRVVGFGRFTIGVESEGRRLCIFKHAVDWIEPEAIGQPANRPDTVLRPPLTN